VGVIALAAINLAGKADRPAFNVTSVRPDVTVDAFAVMEKVKQLLKDSKPGDAANILGALDLLDQVLVAYPRFGYGMRLKAHLQRGLRKPGQAITSYEQYLETFPQDQRTMLTLAQMYLAAEQAEKARPLLQVILADNPLYAEAHKVMAETYDALGESQWALDSRARHKSLAASGKGRKPASLFLSDLPADADKTP